MNWKKLIKRITPKKRENHDLIVSHSKSVHYSLVTLGNGKTYAYNITENSDNPEAPHIQLEEYNPAQHDITISINDHGS